MGTWKLEIVNLKTTWNKVSRLSFTSKLYITCNRKLSSGKTFQETERFMRRFVSASDYTREKKFKKERRMNIMVIIMCIAFNISWFPYGILCFIKLFDSDILPPTITVFPLLFAKRSMNHSPYKWPITYQLISI